MHQFVCLAFQVPLTICALLFCCCGGTSIRLSPLGIVTVCPGGQVLLTCERISGSFLRWHISIPHLAMSREAILSSIGVVSATYLNFGTSLSTTFNITRTSGNPLISQMMVTNVTTAINGSTIYCSTNSDENGAPMVTINVINEESNLLFVTMVSHFLRNDITVTLQWPRKAGAVYRVNVMPETPHTELINTMHDHALINLTISYNIQHNVSIASSLCGVTTNRVLQFNYVTCDLPSQLLEQPVIVDPGSQVIPYREGQFITYTCPHGWILTGPNTSECTGNGSWEPDPGQVDCKADCGVPLVDRKVILNYSSTLEDSILILICESDTSTDGEILRLSVICHSSGSWIPDPTQFTCSPISTTVPPGTEILIHSTPHSSDSTNLTVAVFSSTIVVVSAVCSIVFLSIGYACGWFSLKHKQSHTRKAENDEKINEGSQLPPTPGPLYEELQQRSTPEHQDPVELKENVAYGPIVK